MKRAVTITRRIAFIALAAGLILGVVPVSLPVGFGSWPAAFAEPSSNPGTVVFASTRSGNSDVYFMDTTSAGPARQVTTNTATDRRPHPSPDGKKVVFESNRANGTSYNIWLISRNGAGQWEEPAQQLTTGTSDQWPKWSPDGSKIVYQSLRSELASTNHVFVMNADGSNQACRFNCVNTADDTNPDWSDDGTRIVFASVRPPHRVADGCSVSDREIYVRLSDGSGGSTRLSGSGCGNGALDSEPAFSRHRFADAEIAFSSNRSGSSQIHKMRSNGSGVVQLTSGSNFKSRSHFSSNTDPKILYTEIISGSSEVMIINADGSASTDLTQFPAAADNSGGFCCQPRSEYQQRESNGNQPQAALGADPVNLASGNMAYTESDLAIASVGPQVSLVRTHNNTDQRTRSLGPGWRTNLEEEIRYTSGLSTGGVTWVRGDGRDDNYLTTTVSGTYQPTNGRHERIVRNSTRFEATDTANVVHRFDLSGRLMEVKDRRGIGYNIGRGSDGLIQDVTHTQGPKIHLEYDPATKRLSSAAGSDGLQVSYTHTSGRLTSATKQGGRVWAYGYDAEGRLFEVIDPSGKTVYEADLFAGQVVGQRDGNGNGQSTITYNPDPTSLGAGSTARKDEFGRSLTDTWDSRGFATTATNQDGYTTAHAYNSAGDRTETTDAIGVAWRTAYTTAGDPKEMTSPIGAVFRAEYRPDHQPNSTTDPTGISTNYSYDAFGTLTSVDIAGPAGTTNFIPNSDGSISATISPDGLISRTEYDSQGRPVKAIDGGDRAARTIYNPDGTVAATIGPDGAATTTSYDSALRPDQVTDPLSNSTTFGYDTAGNQTSVTDPRGQTVSFGYDPAYNLVETSTTIEGGEVVQANFSYDAANRLAQTTYPGTTGQATNIYGPSGKLRSTVDPDGATWTYSYSGRGEMTEAIAPDGRTTRFFYDAAGRLTSTENSAEGTTQYEYDLSGRPLIIQVGGRDNLHRRFGYDNAGRLIESEDRIAEDSAGQTHPYLVTSTLSPGGRRQAHSQGRYMPDGQSESVSAVSYAYNSDGTMASVSSPQLVGGSITNTYDPVTGRVTARSAPGLSTDYGTDLAGRADELTHTLPAGTIAFPTRYDQAGNVISMGDSTYTYDAMGRLKTAYDADTGATWTYGYDRSSNRTSAANDQGFSQTLSFGSADEITTPGHVYDDAGRLISDTANGLKRTYHWDGYGRLSGIDSYNPNSGRSRIVRMLYDTSGRLVEKSTYLDLSYQVERLFYHYDGDRLVSEEDMTGTVREYLYAGGEAPTAMRARQGDGSYANFFFVTNTHGDVVAVTDRDGVIVNRYAYGPWGEATRVSEQVHQPFRYAGYRYEDGFDLYYLRARWMDPNTGRFLSRDPNRGTRADAVSLNRYGYAAGAPSSAVDSAGLAPTKVIFVPGVDPRAEGTGTDSAFADWLMNIDVATGGALSATYFVYESGPVYSNAKRCLSRIGGCSGVGADAAMDLARYLDGATSQFASIHVIAHSLGSWVALEGIRGSQRFVDTLILAGGSTPINSQSKPGNLGVLVNMCSDADRGWKQSQAIASCRADEHITAKIPGDHSAYVRTEDDRRHLANRELESFYLAIWTRLFGINFN